MGVSCFFFMEAHVVGYARSWGFSGVCLRLFQKKLGQERERKKPKKFQMFNCGESPLHTFFRRINVRLRMPNHDRFRLELMHAVIERQQRVIRRIMLTDSALDNYEVDDDWLSCAAMDVRVYDQGSGLIRR